MTAFRVAVAVLIGAVVVPPVTLACSCAEYRDAKAGLAKSGLVVVGKVRSARTVALPRTVYVTDKLRHAQPGQVIDERGIYTVDVARSWKGQLATVEVLAGLPDDEKSGQVSVDCDIHLELGKEYLLFISEGYSEVDSCSPSGRLEDRAKEILELDSAQGRTRGVAPSK
jgi:hypothetical protein